MSRICWTEDLNTNIKAIDEQHKRIVDYINQLHDMVEAGETDQGNIARLLRQLVEYTVSHFSFEESLMENAGYTSIVPHKRIHQHFVDGVSRLSDRHNNGEDVAKELLRTLKNWLVNHIKVEDAKYVDAVATSMDDRNKEDVGWLGRALNKFFVN
ncbi:MAG: bacteriohemerythrin [Gammaproteobacteria bacterium]|nr:MAG: bacteriohemerythrin [Gammaproteobacteria bacterium]